MNLQCSAAQSGKPAPVTATDREPVTPDTPIVNSDGQPLPFDASTGSGTIPCGSSTADRIPYFVMLVFMIGTTFYQQRQMQKASPPGAASGQQQAILKLMPIMFGFFGYAFPAGLVLYWTTSNLWQIGQQYALLRAGHIGPEAMERRMAEQRAKASSPEPPKQGFFARLMDQAGQQQAQRGNPKSGGAKGLPSKGTGSKGTPRGSKGTPGGAQGAKGGSGSAGSKGGQRPAGDQASPPTRAKSRRPNTGRPKPKPDGGSNGQTPNGGDGGDGEAGS
jgi:YidC/Oxa1 family membrane protein insertase